MDRSRHCVLAVLEGCWLIFTWFIFGQSVGTAQTATQAGEIQHHLQRARSALGAHDLQLASSQYREILKLDPQNVESYTGLGVTLYGLKKPAEAIPAFEAALKIEPGQETAQRFLGLSEAALGHCVQAIPSLQRFFDQSKDLKLQRLEGLSLVSCYEDQSRFEDALRVAQALQQQNPDDPEVLFHLAEIHSSLLNRTVDELLKKHPDSYRFHQIAGETLEAEGNDKQAIKEYRRALQLNPSALRIHYRIGRLLLRSTAKADADEQALTEFRDELAANPSDAAAEYQIGEIQATNHRNADARQSFQRALELAPTLAEAQIGLAKIDLQDHQPEQSVAALQNAIKIQPSSAAAHYTLMLAYRDLGKQEQAMHEMQVFQALKTEESSDFRSELKALLSDGLSATQVPASQR